jgi:uncharacterized damage-inducible protein DinB
METDELKAFFMSWDHEAAQTAALMRTLPHDQYDFRPDPEGRSLGELAWHLAEGEAYVSVLVAEGRIDPAVKPPGIERPLEVAELAPRYERVHADAKARLTRLTRADLGRELVFFDGRPMSISRILWATLLYHLIHHRGQLTLMCRLAKGVPPGMYGPNREQTAALRAGR